MPKLMDNMEEYRVHGSSFTFSGARPETLGATEYTLATITVDVTGSVFRFKDDLLRMLKEAVKACKKSPRAENLMVRVVLFNEKIMELHGFRPVNAIDPDLEYKDLNPDGMTALYDATYENLAAMFSYAKILTDQDYGVNGISFVITDGMDNKSSFVPSQIAKLVDEVRQNEQLESMINILVGINVQNGEVKNALNQFKFAGKFDHYIETQDADSKTLARLAAFVSKSISSQSQSLGSGSSSVVPSF